MPDDGDADVGPASDREDPFGRGSDQRSGDRGPDPSSDAHDTPTPPIAGGAAGSSEVSDGPLFPAAEGRPDRSGTPDAAGAPAPASGASRRAPRSSTASFFRELPVLLLVAFLLAFLLRTFVLQVFFIPSGSMEPTLQVDDRMVVEKITYLFREPVRGEVVVFEGESLGDVDPDATAGERLVRGVGQFLGVVPASARDYVKRVIGLPGDEIVIEEGLVLVNGQQLDEPYVVFEDLSDFGPVTVPEDNLFFLGDNRPNSSDSRRGLGFVPVDAVVGRSAVVIWPFDNIGSLIGVEHELGGPPAQPAVDDDVGAATG